MKLRYLRRYLRRAALLLSAAALWNCFEERMAGGSTEVGNSGVVAGRVLTLDGTPAAGARVRLLPQAFDPGSGDSLPSAWTAFTDADGRYALPDAVPGSYSIEAEDTAKGTLALIQGVAVTGNGAAPSQPAAQLTEPGSVSFPLAGEPAGGHYYLPGTGVSAEVDSAVTVTGRLTLPRVPAGRFAQLIHASAGSFARNLLGRPIEVKAGAGLDLGPYHAWRALYSVTIDLGPASAALKNDLLGFPLLLRLDAANFDFSSAKPDGGDVRVTMPDGATDIPFEIESWDALNKQAVLWIRADTLHAGAVATFNLFAGQAEAASASNPKAVFDTASAFVAAWHLGLDLQDATAFGNQGADAGSKPAAGLIGVARQFDGTGKHVAVADGPSLNFGSGDLTLSAWIFPDSLDTTRQVFAKRDAVGDYEIQLGGDGTVEAALSRNGAGVSLHSTSPLRRGQWCHLAFVRSAGKAYLYLNGALEAGPADLPEDADSKAELWIGDDPVLAGKEGFDGRIDEIEFARAGRSAEWERILYVTQKPASKAVQVSAVP